MVTDRRGAGDVVTGRDFIVGGGKLSDLGRWAADHGISTSWRCLVSPRALPRLRGLSLTADDRVHWAPGVTAQQFAMVHVCASTVAGGVSTVAGVGWGVNADEKGPRS